MSSRQRRISGVRRLLYAGVALSAAVSMLAAGAILAIDHRFSSVTGRSFYQGCLKVWAHRGYTGDGIEQNTLRSFARAFELGAPGTELDIHFDAERRVYIVSHDYPYRLKNGRQLRLEEVFERFRDRGYFWLDFKNLGKLSRQEAGRALATLKILITRYDLLQKVTIESNSATRLQAASELGLHTSYMLANIGRNPLRRWFRIYLAKFHILRGYIDSLSLRHTSYSDSLIDEFSYIPIYLFTVNNKTDLKRLVEKDNVRIVLSDTDFYGMSSCD